MPEWMQVGIGLLATIGGLSGIAALGSMMLQWRKAEPEIAIMYEEMATKQAEQIDKLRYEVNDLRDHSAEQDEKIKSQNRTIARMRTKLKELTEGIRRLVAQIEVLGETPVWAPNEEDFEEIED